MLRSDRPGVLDRFPDGMNEDFRCYIVHALELFAAALLACLVLAVATALAAFRPPGFVIYGVDR